MDYVTQSILSDVAPSFDDLLDTKNSSNEVFFDFENLELKLNPDNIKTTNLTMIGHSYHFCCQISIALILFR